MILIHPPIAKSCEPPAGIARLAGTLQEQGVPNQVVDANLEGILTLLRNHPEGLDTWTSRARRHLTEHLHALKSEEGYQNLGRYNRAVLDLNRLLEKSNAGSRFRVGLANFFDTALSPLKSLDLMRSAEKPEENPFFGYFRSRLLGLLEEAGSGVVGISLNYLSQALCAFSMIGVLKRESPKLRVVLGGGLATSWVRMPGWKNPFRGLVDDLVAGPGESFLLSMFQRQERSWGCTPEYAGFPVPEYFAPGFILPYSASSGCYWRRCSFCPENAEASPYKALPPRHAVQEVRELSDRFQPILIHFLDNAMSPALLEEIALRGLPAPWYGFSRFTHHLRDQVFCHSLKRSGCVMLKLGLESGDPHVLEHLQKGIDLETASLALANLKTAGIGTYVYLLFGTPAETAEGAGRTLEFTVRHGACIDFLNVAVFNMPAGGSQAARFKTRPFYEGDLSLYTDFVHPSGWSRALVRQFLDKEFRRHPVIAGILRKDPPLFTSNHAPFFVKAFPWAPQ